MEGLGQLIIFSIVMLVGSYGAGSAPLFMPMSEEKLHLVSVMGAGLLVGVAFAVIIPEGVLALIKAYTLRSHHHSIQQRSDIDPRAVVDASRNDNHLGRQLNEDHHDGQIDHDHGNDGHTFEGLDRVMGISLVFRFHIYDAC